MELKTIATIGAVTMGRAIAYAAGLGGYKTILKDVSDKVLSNAVGWIRDEFEEGVKRVNVEAAACDAALARLTTSVVEEAIHDAELIIEAVPEELKIKMDLFAIFDKAAKPNAILASYTSVLSISEFSDLLVGRERCIVLHFFNQVPKMRLVEIVRTRTRRRKPLPPAARSHIVCTKKRPVPRISTKPSGWV